ncbi:Pr6Pr family membrane protein [Arthrobacter ruber]|uniref:Pr6Pr family membrane protein n=1 Tax=Arthrobacter ruber TaxID=1258893 RepID=UPI000CF4085F|nr:Pr6Pr family membrane protein [Arthrobacter ruber]
MTGPVPGVQRVPLRPAVRGAVAVVVLVAVAATFFDTASRGPVNPFNFFGFFTMQSNIAAALVLLLTAALQLRGSAGPEWLTPLRAVVTTYMLVVGVVYNLLLAGLAGGVELPWANWVLHVAFPIYAVVDWVVTSDRRRLSYRVIRLIVAYPVVWILVVLLRGATDGWVPYPFLDPASGYASVLLYVVGIAVAIAGFGALVILISRSTAVGGLVAGVRRSRA